MSRPLTPPRSRGTAFPAIGLVAALAAVAGCAPSHPDPALRPAPFHLASVAKTDIDLVTEHHQARTLTHLRTLADKLYRRNPREWAKAGWSSRAEAMAALFPAGEPWRFPDVAGRHGTDAVHLALDPDYTGDRVAALINGLGGMILTAYGDRTEFFVLDDLDAQSLYNAARNLEIAAWMLRTSRDARGAPLLLSNAVSGRTVNLSFERLFGKMIAHQDSIAAIIAQKRNRRIKHVIQNVASAVFLPI